ncbi:hypothetical protein I551_8203, partial [Mycobacterium ulcerans str. Harvey]
GQHLVELIAGQLGDRVSANTAAVCTTAVKRCCVGTELTRAASASGR